MSVEKSGNVKNKKYEFVAPDGGWGYMIWIAAIINFSATTAFVGSIGMIFKDFWEEIEMGSTSVTFMNGISAVCVAIAGFLTGPLLKIMSMRQIAFVASLLLNLGGLWMVFVRTKVPLFITTGLLQGTGFGILYNISCTVINEYFVEKRLLAVSVTQTMSALAAMVAPQFIKWTLKEYGYRGTLLLISAVSLQTFVATVLIQPVAWHMKKVEIQEENKEEMKSLLVDDKNRNDKIVTTPTIQLTDTECVSAIAFERKNENDKIPVSEDVKTKGILTMIKTVLGLSDLKKLLLSNASLGLTVCMFTDFNFILMLPQALSYDMKWDDETVAKALTLIGLGDLVTRIMFIFLNKWLLKIGSQEIYIAGLIVGVVTRLGMLWWENTTVVLIFITIMGASRCIVTVLPPLVIADSVDPDKFASAMGLIMLLFGVESLVLGPAIGAIRDLTDSYVTVFYILTSCYAIVVMFWTIELCYKRNKNRRIQMDNSKKSCNKNKGK